MVLRWMSHHPNPVDAFVHRPPLPFQERVEDNREAREGAMTAGSVPGETAPVYGNDLMSKHLAIRNEKEVRPVLGLAAQITLHIRVTDPDDGVDGIILKANTPGDGLV